MVTWKKKVTCGSLFTETIPQRAINLTTSLCFHPRVPEARIGDERITAFSLSPSRTAHTYPGLCLSLVASYSSRPAGSFATWRFLLRLLLRFRFLSAVFAKHVETGRQNNV